MKDQKLPTKHNVVEVIPDDLREDIRNSLDNVVNGRSLPQAVDRVVAVLSEHRYSESKLPSAFELESIESVVAGGAREAIDMAKAEQDFIISETQKNNRRSFIVSLLGPIFGFCALLSLIALCVFMVKEGQAGVAAAVVGAIGVSAAIFCRPERAPEAKPQKKK